MRRRLVHDCDRTLFHQEIEPHPCIRISIRRPVMELVHAVRPWQVGEFDPNGWMLVLLRVAAHAGEPRIILAHLLGPDAHHRLRHSIRSTERGEIHHRLLDRRRIEITLAGDARIAAMLAVRGLFQNKDLRAKIVSGHGGGAPRRSETDHNDVGLSIPLLRHRYSMLRNLTTRGACPRSPAHVVPFRATAQLCVSSPISTLSP